MRNDVPGSPNPAAVVDMPAHCPTCSSQDLKTTSKVITSDTYWRCAACGEVWNVGRLRTASRYVGRHSSFR